MLAASGGHDGSAVSFLPFSLLETQGKCEF